MPISRPTTKTIISTQGWGIPITDEVNRLTTQSDSNTSRVTALEAATAKTTWTNATLLNGWVNMGAPMNVTQYRKIGDIVYLRGYVYGGSAGTNLFTLPVGFRPPATLAIPCSGWTGTARATIEHQVKADGSVFVSDAGNHGFSYQFSIIA